MIEIFIIIGFIVTLSIIPLIIGFNIGAKAVSDKVI